MKEKYFKVKPKESKLGFLNDTDIIYLNSKGIAKLLTSPQGELKTKLNFQYKNGKYTVNENYTIEEISKESAEKKIEQMDRSFKCLGLFFKTSDNIGSSNLGSNGNKLY